jgi:hypothetical protein
MTPNPDDRQAMLRKLWREHCDACEQAEPALMSAFENGEPLSALPLLPPFPEELRGLTCGAKTRAGTPCKRRDLYRSGRCKLHGGLSTGPTSTEGKLKVSRNACRNKAHERLVKVMVGEE